MFLEKTEGFNGNFEFFLVSSPVKIFDEGIQSSQAAFKIEDFNYCFFFFAAFLHCF